MGEQNNFTRRMFIKGMATSFGALPVFAWPRWAQAFYYNLGFFKKGSAASLYVEDVFSTYLYTGNTSVQTITNGIDLAGKGGLVWIKGKDSVRNHIFRDSARGRTNGLSSNLTDAQVNWVGLEAFNATGFTLGDDGTPGTNTQSGNLNQTGVNFASWTFRKAAKFFDIVTYSGNGNAGGQTITHSLGSDPGMVIIKRTDAVDMWIVHHRSQVGKYFQLESTAAATTFSWITTSSTNFVLANNGGAYNAAGATYVAYLFAHDTAADGLVQCGTFTTDASGNGPTINLGWEPQFLLQKRSDGVDDWLLIDSIRGFPVSGAVAVLRPNTTGAQTDNGYSNITNSGIKGQGSANCTYIYMAIRRGPMKVPTDATKVFNAVTYVGNSTAQRFTPGFVTDLSIRQVQNSAGNHTIVTDRLRGGSYLHTTGTFAEQVNSGSIYTTWDYMDGIQKGSSENETSTSNVRWFFRRAPGFMDVVCYTGTGSTSTYSHSLGVPPELMIIKSRNDVNDWGVYCSALGNTNNLRLNTTAASSSALNLWGSTTPTASVFTTNGTYNIVGGATITYVAYLFASCPGVSKVGTFTGAATDVTVSCGFSGQPRFVLVKRTDALGDWIVVDSARGTSVYLTLNSTTAETSAIVITFTTGGFVAKAGTVANAASGATYIFLAIA